ncbi:thiamine diphosphokinase [Sporosarcina sp. BI001-red]|uniref:thiamine diphosphokinase n=1 Tax=Sporosarcina sp. BI001-red TaxID=2282866 RepID=UPI000E26383E|nr:thiamine diphosphokinase [Sporosarcina sp. BI001-red]REB09714.1 thiamine diphosphokinase [Sporosarcina sp. BI001-red]
MKTIIICAGGPEEEVIPLALFLEENTQFIGADRGTLQLLDAGIAPLAAVGDFDSVSKEEMKRIEATGCCIEKRPPEKDETDTELALNLAYSQNPDKIILTGVTGGRLDHMYSAVQLLVRNARLKPSIQLILANRQNELTLLQQGTHIFKRNEQFPYLSFFSMTGVVRGLTLTGVKYEVYFEDIHLGDTRFTSNEIVEPSCTISMQEGICLMVRSSDS